GLVLGLMSLFPTRNIGLELAAILMIFTAQAWNLAVSINNSLNTLPDPLRDACKVAGWRPSRTFWQLEVPAAAQGLVWNGMLSMAGGWFFLMVNEAFRLGDRDFRLPGVGSYMSVALDRGNVPAMALAILAMVTMIVCVDQLLWRPLVVWVEKFRLDETAGGEGGPPATSWVLEFLRHARLPRRAAQLRRRAYRTARRAARPFERPLGMGGAGGRSGRSLAPPRAAAAARDPSGRVVPGAHVVPARRPLVRARRRGAGTRRRRLDGARGTVVHPVQRHLGGGRDPGTAQRRGQCVSAAAARPLALAVPSRGVPGARDGLGHGGGRRMERLDRRGIHGGGGDAAHHAGTREPDQ